MVDFADPPSNPTAGFSTSASPQVTAVSMPSELIVPEVDPPTTLVEWAVLILNTPHPILKVSALSRSHGSAVYTLSVTPNR